MSDVRNLGTGSGGVGSSRYSGGVSGTRTVGGGAFSFGLPDVLLQHSPATSRQITCASGDNSVYLDNKTALVAFVTPPNNTVAVAIAEYSATADADTRIELNPNGFVLWTPKPGTNRRIVITTDGEVTISICEA